MKTFEWKSDTVYAGGGKKTGKPPTEKGFVTVTDEGLSINPSDDYYSGEMSREDTIALALEILEVHVWKSHPATSASPPEAPPTPWRVFLLQDRINGVEQEPHLLCVGPASDWHASGTHRDGPIESRVIAAIIIPRRLP